MNRSHVVPILFFLQFLSHLKDRQPNVCWNLKTWISYNLPGGVTHVSGRYIALPPSNFLWKFPARLCIRVITTSTGDPTWDENGQIQMTLCGKVFVKTFPVPTKHLVLGSLKTSNTSFMLIWHKARQDSRLSIRNNELINKVRFWRISRPIAIYFAKRQDTNGDLFPCMHK